MNIEHIKKIDPQVAEQIELELKDSRKQLNLLQVKTVLLLRLWEACGSVLTNKYAEGKPHKRYYNGCEHIDVIEEIAQKEHANYFTWIMLTFSLTAVLRQIWQYSWLL